ncbi:hypothetical protein KIF59_03250 [Enterobacter cloacae subsp. cloacae]|nr:hypothetical protein [Enterobacter cloacae subsp. cloacae]
MPENRKPADRDRLPERGRHGLADTTMLHAQANTRCVCLQMDELVADAKVQGDLAAWFGSLPVVAQRSVKASTLLGEKGCETNGLRF